MTIAPTLDRTLTAVPTELAHGRGGGGPAPKRIVVAYGFWIFILSDMVMFSALFAAYAVLSGNNAGGPTGPELFNLRNVFISTMCLLLSSYTCGLGVLSAERRQPTLFLVFAIFTFALGAAFLFIEATEFAGMVAKGAGPLAQRLSIQLLHVSGHARPPCRRRFGRARLSDGPGARSWPPTRRAAAPVVLEPVLARAGYRVGRRIHAGLSDGRLLMHNPERVFEDRTPGVEEHEPTASYLSYSVGLGLAIIATIASFIVAQTNLLWPPGIPVGLIVLALAQIGVHLVFFLHLGSGSDSTNNVLALAFGVLIVFLVITGSVWIIANLNSNMMPMPQ